jgi:type II secretory pathway component PulF
MALYKYSVSSSRNEEYRESGTIVAVSEEEARKKLRAMKFDRVRLKKVRGIKGLVGRLTASIR